MGGSLSLYYSESPRHGVNFLLREQRAFEEVDMEEESKLQQQQQQQQQGIGGSSCISCSTSPTRVTLSSPPHPQKLTPYVFFTCLLAASGGLMYGYDLVVAGGVSIMGDFLQKFYPTVYEAEQGRHLYDNYCKYDNAVLQLYTSSLYMAALLATLAAGTVTRRRGHRASMIVAGLFFVLGTALGAGAANLVMLLVGRIFLGIGIGFSNQCVPLYLSEIAPPSYRGGLHLMFGVNISAGVVGGNLVNYFAQRIHPWGWRLSLAAAGVPAVAILLAGFILVDTPSLLISRGKFDEAKNVLVRIRGCQDIDQEYVELVDAAAISCYANSNSTEIEDTRSNIAAAPTDGNGRRQYGHELKRLPLPCNFKREARSESDAPANVGFRKLLRRRNAAQVVMAIALPLFQQFSGSDAILFYGPFLFKAAGLGLRASLYSTLIIGLVSFVGTTASIFVVDIIGRRKILLTSTSIMFVCMVATGIVFRLDISSSGGERLSRIGSVVELGAVCLFVAMFTASWGPLAWLIPSEICSQDIRSAAQSITVFTNMLFKFVVAQTFLSMLCAFKFGIFLFFAAWLAVMGAFTFFFLPETKGIPIDQMVHVWRAHWFWGHFSQDDGSGGDNNHD